MTRGSFFDEDVPFGIIFPSIGLGRPGPTATTTPALSCDIERRREREREREREKEKGESLAHGTLWNFSKEREREREREMTTNADASTRNTLHSLPSRPSSSFPLSLVKTSTPRTTIGRLELEEKKKKKKKKKKKNRALYSRRFLAAKSHRSFSSPRRRVPPTLCPSKGRAFSPRLGS